MVFPPGDLVLKFKKRRGELMELLSMLANPASGLAIRTHQRQYQFIFTFVYLPSDHLHTLISCNLPN